MANIKAIVALPHLEEQTPPDRDENHRAKDGVDPAHQPRQLPPDRHDLGPRQEPAQHGSLLPRLQHARVVVVQEGPLAGGPGSEEVKGRLLGDGGAQEPVERLQLEAEDAEDLGADEVVSAVDEGPAEPDGDQQEYD